MNARLRVEGLLLGLAAGDRNGGPQRLALRVAETLADHPGIPLRTDVVAQKYLAWQYPPPGDVDRAFDTGPTFERVFARVHEIGLERLPEVVASDLAATKSAGVGAAHRNVVIAMAVWLDDEALRRSAEAESALTHGHPEAIATAAATVALCSQLLRGKDLEAATRFALTTATHPAVAAALTNRPPLSELHSGGHAPYVLEAALHFVRQSTTFHEALAPSLAFAGPANFAPVLVGAIAGALYGAGGPKGVQQAHCLHPQCDTALLARHTAVATRLAMHWPEDALP